jgi:predicted NBD/HSP70 family sugar kinase
MCQQVLAAAGKERALAAVGVGVPGFVRNGVVEEAPNLPQLKGSRIADMLAAQLRGQGIEAPVALVNDADGFAAGIAASLGKLDTVIRVWTLGVGIGYGRYPLTEGVWEGGHTVVTLDDKENFCGCGGRGHLEGIMGHRAMRLRFLDMEPEEVFEEAKLGDIRCLEFKRLWHKALAAATATSIHLRGPGRFFLAGFNVRFVDMPLLKDEPAAKLLHRDRQGRPGDSRHRRRRQRGEDWLLVPLTSGTSGRSGCHGRPRRSS